MGQNLQQKMKAILGFLLSYLLFLYIAFIIIFGRIGFVSSINNPIAKIAAWIFYFAIPAIPSFLIARHYYFKEVSEILAGKCKHCGNATYFVERRLGNILLAIFLFPVGLTALLKLYNKYCSSCGQKWKEEGGQEISKFEARV